MHRAQARRGETRRRIDPSTAVTLMLALVLTAALGLAPTAVEANGGSAGMCPGSVLGGPFEQVSVSEVNRQIQCKYLKRDSNGVHMVFLSARWIDPGNDLIPPYWCEDAADRSCPCKHDKAVSSSCECFPWPNESTLSVKVSLIRLPASKAKKAWRAASKWAKELRSRAAVCPAALASPEPRPAPSSGPDSKSPSRTTTIELTGDRLARLDEDGIGAVIELTPEERDALVASLGNVTLTDEHLGTRGRVVEVGTVARAADDGRVVSVTVELLGDEPEPALVLEPEAEPMDVAREAGQALMDDLVTQLDEAAGKGGSIDVGAELIDRLAGLEAVQGKIAEVRLEDGEVFVRTKDTVKEDGTTDGGRSVWIRPVVEEGRVDIELRTRIRFTIIGISYEEKLVLTVGALVFIDEELPERIKGLIGDVNAEISDRDLRVAAGGVVVKPEGIKAVVEPKPQQ